MRDINITYLEQLLRITFVQVVLIILRSILPYFGMLLSRLVS